MDQKQKTQWKENAKKYVGNIFEKSVISKGTIRV